MLADIQSGIGELLKTDGSSEAQIRRVLQERYEAGALRKETYQLVKSMLDHFVSETIPTSPTPKTLQAAKARKASPIPSAAMSVPAMDKFSATTTIPVKLAPKARRESQVQVGSVLRDRFMLQEEVSGGSMGVVYKALDRRPCGSRQQRSLGRDQSIVTTIGGKWSGFTRFATGGGERPLPDAPKHRSLHRSGSGR